ncbi:uracil-DNA glycosylase [Oceanibium sediminis]|uniref:uracil-DNA glycosylase n=1 Tax=Oceanibium sediminis TaxID=2026339 RepID=UPI001E3B0F70|nr:uracil-DNA glycosylase [Oceanibium sediminis]
MMLDTSRLGAWGDLPFFDNEFKDIQNLLASEERNILPPADRVFAALEAAEPDDVRVVLLGQDPYPTAGHANGLCFSVNATVRPLPRSLSNIFKEMRSDLGEVPPHGDLSDWSKQGVLMLNAALTVPEGVIGGHLKIGWRTLAEQVLHRLNDRPRAFILWGQKAQALGRVAKNPEHFKLESAHPSPMSARRGFFGSHPFSRVNAWLTQRGEPAIAWT